MRRRTIQLCATLLLATAAFPLMGAAKEYRAGNGAPVNGWNTPTYEEFRNPGMPICLYIYDAVPKCNEMAERFETTILSNEEVKKILPKFRTMKIRHDGRCQKGKSWVHMPGWPDAMLRSAEGGVALLLLSTDGRKAIRLDSTVSLANQTPEVMLKAANDILEYDTKNKEAARVEAEKRAKLEPKEAEPPPVLPGLIPDKNKKPPEKKPAGPQDE